MGQSLNSIMALTKRYIGWLMTDACLWLHPLWATLRFSIALAICEAYAIFFVSS